MAFDIDGVLIDSRAAVKEAYSQVGISMPDSAWGKPWYEWLPSQCGGDVIAARKVHALKGEVYSEMAPPLLPAARLAFRIATEHSTRIAFVTGAGLRAAEVAVMRILPDEDLPYFLMYGCDLAMKGGALRTLGQNGNSVAYIDDLDDDRALEWLGSQGENIRVVKYVGQDEDELRNQIWM